jgi:hypothetical protein
MEILYTLSKVCRKMTTPPIGQNIYHYFDGATGLLDNEQKRELLTIINQNHEEITSYIQSTITDENKTSS